ncbi:MAG: AAA family ATPase, partial [Candidatus Adiutrix sp.]|nr:AAA family ATPase [Candidatus Adiutrix sp.]
MRILHLRLSNLNSLAGEWAIDFTHPDYRAQGLFAITGPTGAGKTTVLDAVCLALYGATPRLGRLTKSANEIMTRQRGECAAELTFETPAGRFRAHWSQRRAKKNAVGDLQEPRHEIVDDESGRVIESARTKTLAAVENVTGMNFAQFTRAMMLAQGAFAAFLEAPADERADLLEQITGTDSYSVISMEAHRRKAEERAKKDGLDRQLAGLAPEHSEEALTAELAVAETALTQAETALAKTSAALAWLKKLAELSANRAGLVEREKRLTLEIEAFAPQARRLELAAKARPGEGLYGQLKMLRAKREQSAAALAVSRRELPGLAQAAEAAGAALKTAEEAGLLAQKKEAEARPALNEARALDLKLLENEKRRAPLKERLTKIAAELAATVRSVFEAERHDFPSWSRKLAEVGEALSAQREMIETQSRTLAALLAGREISAWRDELLALNRRGDLLAKLAEELTSLDALKKEVLANTQSRQKSAAELAAVAGDLKAADEALKALEREAVHLSARWDLQQRVRSLEAHRPRLKDGQPCPLCGALHHPYADPENRPAEDVTTAMMAESRVALEAARKKITALTAEESRLTQLAASLQTAAAKLAEGVAALEKNVGERRSALGLNAGAEELRPAEVIALRGQLQKDAAQVDRRMREAEKLEKELAALEKLTARQAEVKQAAERLLAAAAEARDELEVLNGEQARFSQSRRALFGGQAADEAEKNLRLEASQAAAALEKNRRAALDADAALAKRKTVIAETEAALATLEQESLAYTKQFLEAINGHGFPDEAAWLAAALPENERAALEKRAGALAEERAGLAAKLKDAAERLEAETAQKITTATLAEAESARTQGEAERAALGEQRAVLRQKLADLRHAGEKRLELLALLEAQNRECRRWDRLHELIGSADGKKFRNFAQ